MGFVYEDISLEQRAQIGMIAAVGHGTYGMITGLAQELGTSRKFVYSLADKVRRAVVEAVRPLAPGPKPALVSLVVDQRQLDRAIVTLALEGRMAERPIAACLGELYHVEPSLGYIDGVLAKACLAAEQFNLERVLALSEAQAEGDELFACGRPHLVVVEHSSLLILALERPERCDEQSWLNLLEEMIRRGVGLARLASDGGESVGDSHRRASRGGAAVGSVARPAASWPSAEATGAGRLQGPGERRRVGQEGEGDGPYPSDGWIRP